MRRLALLVAAAALAAPVSAEAAPSARGGSLTVTTVARRVNVGPGGGSPQYVWVCTAHFLSTDGSVALNTTVECYLDGENVAVPPSKVTAPGPVAVTTGHAATGSFTATLCYSGRTEWVEATDPTTVFVVTVGPVCVPVDSLE